METLYRAGLSNALSATVLALFVACLGRILARRPAVLHCLWLIVLVKLVTPPLYEIALPITETFGWLCTPVPAVELADRDGDQLLARASLISPRLCPPVEWASSAIILEVDPHFDCDTLSSALGPPNLEPGAWSSTDWMRVASLIWIAGTLITLAVSTARIRRFQQWLRGARPAEPEMQDWVDDLAVSLGLNQTPLVYWAHGQLSPLVWPVGWRPRLVIPSDLWKSLDDRQRTTLVIHELAHLRRGDHYVRLFELLVTALFWWHPVVWWVRQSLRDVEEQCCDAWVVWAFPDAARSYAETLLETVDFLNRSELSEPLLASGFGKVHHLRKRLTMIMNGTTPRLVGLWGTLGSVSLAAALLPVNATWAQKPEDKKEVRIIVNADDTRAPNDGIVAIEDGTLTLSTDAVLAAIEDDGSPDLVRLEIKTDDSSDTIVTDSLGEAISKIKDQIKEIDKGGNLSEQQKARKRTLERVVRELESAAKQTKDPKVTSDKVKKVKDVKVVALQRAEDAKAMSPEKKAEIDKARAKIKELAQSLQAKQKELAEARSRLSKLEGEFRSLVRAGDTRVEARAIRLRDLPRIETDAPKAGERRVVVERRAEGGEKRLDNLEKRLKELLDEVGKLKNTRSQ